MRREQIPFVIRVYFTIRRRTQLCDRHNRMQRSLLNSCGAIEEINATSEQ